MDLTKQELQSTSAKVLVQSDFAQLSGAGTAMHSRVGKSTIPLHHLFHQPEDNKYKVSKEQ